jgi:hypothetical protein
MHVLIELRLYLFLPLKNSIVLKRHLRLDIRLSKRKKERREHTKLHHNSIQQYHAYSGCKRERHTYTLDISRNNSPIC